jgi:hypothetical protein
VEQLRAVELAPRPANWPGITSALTGEIEAVILNVAAELAEIRSQVPPGQRSDPLLADALERLTRARERLAGLRARAAGAETPE